MKTENPPSKKPPAWLHALADEELPSEASLDGAIYRRARSFKHDFFAATGLYEGPRGRVVLKMGRQARLFGLPMAWIGRLLTRHEARLYGLVDDLPGVPRFLGAIGRNAFLHEYVEGRELNRDDRLPDDFFPRLAELIRAIHARGIAYVDLEKRENILLGDDGRPYLIDFQISWHWPANRGGDTWPARAWLRLLQSSDRYHLLKHWRRYRPDQLSPEQLSASQRPPIWISWHRLLFRPFTVVRRRILEHLGARPRRIEHV